MSLAHNFPWQLQPNAATSSTSSTPSGSGFHCSVRHCDVSLPPNSNHKMCEACRGRHRIYAITKRAKRKAEKAVVVDASPTDSDDPFQVTNATPEYSEPFEKDASWMPTMDSVNPAAQVPKPPSSSFTKLLESNTRLSTFSLPENWITNNSNIDPRLFQTSSELAGALTYDTLAPTPPDPEEISAPSNPRHSPEVQSQPQCSAPESGPSVSQEKPLLSTPLRYCSVKGCKTIMSGASFFKMCDPCRIRYRGYGTTKRAKWKQEREGADEDSERLRDDISSHGSIQSETQDLDCPSWEEPVQFQGEDGSPESSTTATARMCTVSHCRQPLPTGHEFRRCDQHRLQNRHHSKLKREREKEVKAHAKSRWAEAVTSPEAHLPHAQEREITLEPLFTATPLDLNNRERRPKRVAESVIRSTSGGVKRTNYTCSSKMCHNLLNPSVPWKACDSCREHDRSIRKGKSVRTNSKTLAATSPVLSDNSLPSVQQDQGQSGMSNDIEMTQVEVISPQIMPNLSSDVPMTTNCFPSSIHGDPPSFTFDELMLPEMPDTMSPNMQAHPYTASSIETFTSVFQAAVTAQPSQIRFAKPVSSTSTPARCGSAESVATTSLPTDSPPTSTDIPEGSVAGSEIEFKDVSDAAATEKRKSRKKKGTSKRIDKADVTKESDRVTDVAASTQVIMPTTVSPQSVEINPTHPPLHSPLASNSSSAFPQYSPAPYNPSFPPPVLPYYMPPPFAAPYGVPQPPQYFYPPTYPYARPPPYYQQYPPPLHHAPSPPSHIQSPHRVPHYPYQYTYSYPYSHSSGYTAPSYTPGSYPQLQWSTAMTPQAPPPRSATYDSATIVDVQPDPIDNVRKRKRHEDHGSRDVIDVDSSPTPPRSLTTPAHNLKTIETQSPKQQPFTCSKPSCKRMVSAASTMCDRCKEKLKRHQAKAKKRFKLEPRVSPK